LQAHFLIDGKEFNIGRKIVETAIQLNEPFQIDSGFVPLLKFLVAAPELI
jgi:hypothetical protein